MSSIQIWHLGNHLYQIYKHRYLDYSTLLLSIDISDKLETYFMQSSVTLVLLLLFFANQVLQSHTSTGPPYTFLFFFQIE